MITALVLVAADSLGPWAQVRAKYQEIRSLSGRFTESVTYAEGYQEHFEGKIYLVRPDKVRLEATSPQKQLIVSDGSEAWLYLPGSAEAIKQPVSEVSKACDPRLFLMDTPPDFKVEYARRDSSHTYTFIPPPGSSYPYQKVSVTLGPDLNIRGVSVVDPMGNIYAFSLRDLVVNPELDEGLFRFTPPPGTEVFGK